MTFAVDLSNCDREPIHIPGSIQPHGVMLVCEGDPLEVRWACENAGLMLGAPDGVVQGRSLADILGEEAAHRVGNAVAKSMNPNSPGLVFSLHVSGSNQAFDVAAHACKGRTFIEFQAIDARDHGVGPLEMTRALVRRLAEEATIERLARSAARMVRAMLGYDRVMIYRMLHNNAGRVIAEDRDPDLGSFLGLHFPASDIPAQARELYVRNWIRMISDVNYAPVPLLPPIRSYDPPIDMSFAQLRSVSPVHCEYLRNMRVSASLSISLIVGGRLWGLVACHHYSPKAVSLPHRVGAELFGQFMSMQIEALERRTRFEAAEQARQRLDRIVSMLAPEQELAQSLRQRLPDLAGLVECDGAGLLIDGVWLATGRTPREEAVRVLVERINAAEGSIWTTTQLAKDAPETADDAVAGVLATPISHKRRDYLFYFRVEEGQHVDWAGDPEKPATLGPLGERLTPRKSFDLWREEVRGQATPWSDADLAIAEAAQNYLRDVVLLHAEATADERRRADTRRRLLNEELNHRVKNILALTRSIVSQSRAGARTMDDFAAAVAGRLGALSFAHDHVTRDRSGGDLRALLESEFAAYVGQREAGRIRLDGPAVRFDARAFSSVALVVHELATNAVKYGSLKDSSGVVDVTWSVDARGDFTMTWSETGVTLEGAPQRRGFGTRLICDVIPYDLGGAANLAYEADGLKASFRIPARHVALEETPAPDEAAAGAIAGADADLAGLRVLLVEDQMLIALDAEAALRELGAADVVVASSAAEGLRLAGSLDPDVAILDVNLGDGTSAEVAQALQAKETPFIFASGYQEMNMLPAHLRAAPLVRKPYTKEELAAGVAQALNRPAPRSPLNPRDPPSADA
jgi:light-regulated signal transduction histidine kinase (bacteriophytochrome)